MDLHLQQVDSLIIRNGRLIDPVAGRDQQGDLFIDHGVITDSPPKRGAEIDAAGLIVSPGLMDIHVHLREPGQTHKETIETGSAAAAAGGFTYVACMPNTQPPLDNPQVIRQVAARAREIDVCEVGIVACITKGRSGRDIADLAVLLEAGAIGFSDDGTGVEDDEVMDVAFREAARLDALIIQHCEYQSISAGGVMHLGEVSRRLNLPGLDPRSEEAMIERDIGLAAKHGARYHVAHISTARAVEMVRCGRANGVRVTAEVCAHHLLLTDEACATGDPNTKMHPPLRTREDVDACRRGLLDGTIDCIVTDHAPHTAEEKGRGILSAPPGIVGLETAVGVAAKAMIESGLADWPAFVAWFTQGPARVVRRARPGLQPGLQAELSLLDPDSHYRVDASRFRSKCRNTPFSGLELRARAVGTIRGRKVALLPECHVKARF